MDEGTGAVYNDLKEKNVLLELEQQITFSQMSEDDLRQVDTNDIVPQEAVEKSILEHRGASLQCSLFQK